MILVIISNFHLSANFTNVSTITFHPFLLLSYTFIVNIYRYREAHAHRTGNMFASSSEYVDFAPRVLSINLDDRCFRAYTPMCLCTRPRACMYTRRARLLKKFSLAPSSRFFRAPTLVFITVWPPPRYN